VLQVPMIARDVAAGTITYIDPGNRTRSSRRRSRAGASSASGRRTGRCGGRARRRLRDGGQGPDRLCDAVVEDLPALGGTPPEGFNYELFLDEKGEKISKSKGNGITIEEWLTYASPESLSLYMFQKPKSAKKLYFDVIPKTVDEYLTFLAKYPDEDARQAASAIPTWHIHTGQPPETSVPVSFALMLNLVSASNAEDKATLWGFIKRYAPDADPQTHPILDQLTEYAIAYYRDFVLPTKSYRAPTDEERTALEALDAALADAPADATAEDLQTLVYEAGKANGFADNLRDWFRAIYEVLLGQSQGPRFGSFIALYGVDETRAMIRDGLSRAS
jgi:lysyl-tRNA synthetase class 1